MKTTKLIPTLCVLVLLAHSFYAATFTFTGNVNDLWEDPINWSPGYPGMFITEGDQVVIHADCTIDGHQIVNHGGILISGAAKLNLYNGALIENYNTLEVQGSLQLSSAGAVG